jgi:nicotinamide-nucleotide adenylyltransferase
LFEEIKERYNRILFPGRFQPLHYGHIEVIKWMLNFGDEIIIAIGSTQKSHMVDNPFTAGERMVMIREALKEEGFDLSKFYIVPVPDIEYNSIWISYLESLLPPFDAVCSRNPLVIRLAKEERYDVLVPPFFLRSEYSGKKIRKKMLSGEKWESYVPPSVARIIKQISGIQRLIDSSLSDELE